MSYVGVRPTNAIKNTYACKLSKSAANSTEECAIRYIYQAMHIYVYAMQINLIMLLVKCAHTNTCVLPQTLIESKVLSIEFRYYQIEAPPDQPTDPIDQDDHLYSIKIRPNEFN